MFSVCRFASKGEGWRVASCLQRATAFLHLYRRDTKQVGREMSFVDMIIFGL